MKPILLKLILLILVGWASLCRSQLYVDYFEPDNIKLARLVWDKSISSETGALLQSSLDTCSYDLKTWALHVMGVHIEQLPAIANRDPSPMENFYSLLIAKLNTARNSENIDSTLISFIDTTVFHGHYSHRATISHYLFDIVAIRLVRHIRENGITKDALYSMPIVERFGSPHQKWLVEFASCSHKEILEEVNSFFAKNEDKSISTLVSWGLTSYRDQFINDFEKYYRKGRFNNVSKEGKRALMHYWLFNNDLLDADAKNQILKLTRIESRDKRYSDVRLMKLMLTNMILNKSKKQHLDDIHEAFETEESKRLKEIMMQKIQSQNPLWTDSLKMINLEQQDNSMRKSRVIRPESLVFIFNNCTEEELLDYLDEILDTELYHNPGLVRNQTVVNIRAAILKLGDMYFTQNKIHAPQSRYDTIVKKLVDVGTSDILYSFGEATRLIYYLGSPAIPFLKTEFYNEDLNRAQFAANKLIELKNLDVVNWMIRVARTNPEPEMQKRARLILKIMKDHRDIQTENRGITKEESDRLAREVIDPYLKDQIIK